MIPMMEDYDFNQQKRRLNSCLYHDEECLNDDVIHVNDQTHELLEHNLYLNHDVNDDLNRFDEEKIEFLSLCRYLYHDVECK